jgi:predicted TIM-barrel fold metal-dependent hydrolase
MNAETPLTPELQQGPAPHPRRPFLKMPAGATDTHFHLFGPQGQYPLVDLREYTPPLISPAFARRFFDTMGIQRAVVIQPSVYGEDNRAQLEGMKEIGIATRAVIVTPYKTSDREMAIFHQQGARGLRYVLAHPGGLPLSELERWASRLKELNWHIQFLAKGPQILEIAERIEKLACPAVIDHIGMIRPSDGLDQPVFRAVLRLLAHGHWVKVSGAYRLTEEPKPFRSLIPFIARMVEERPDRIVWASDWPHVFVKGAVPDTTDLLDALVDWVPDEAARNRILVDNAAALYGF